MHVRFSERERRDLAAAWVALGVAFTAFYFNGVVQSLFGGTPSSDGLSVLGVGFVLSLLTAGIGFLLHELAHKFVAIRYGQTAEFRADYSMLFLAVMAGFAGFLFAAPGAVYHRGRITAREQGLIALAGPAVNVVLVAVFAGVWIGGEAAGFGLLSTIGYLGVIINALLAGFNMLPFGPLDGKKVLRWSRPVWIVTAVPTIGGAIVFFVL